MAPVMITDLDFADDIVLISNEIEQAQLILQRTENECAGVGLFLHTRKTKYMIFSCTTTTPLKTTISSELNRVTDFKYMGS